MQRTEGKARGVTGGSVVVVVILAFLALVRQGAAAGRAFPCCFVVLGGGGRPQWALSSPLPPGASCAARAWGREAWLASSPLMALTAKEVRKKYMAREKGERGGRGHGLLLPLGGTQGGRMRRTRD